MKQKQGKPRSLNTHLLIAFLAFCLFLSISCEKDLSILSPDNNINGILSPDIKSINIQSFDSYSGDNQIKLYWTTGRPIVDPFSPPPPNVKTVRLFVSETGPADNYKLIFESNKDGGDSTLVENFTNGKIYYFRIATYDLFNSLIGVSDPLMTSPGIIIEPSIIIAMDLKENPLYVANLAWSPDGQKLALIKKSVLTKSNLFIIDLNDLSWNQITNFISDDHRLLSVAWSPNGESLAFGYSPTRTYGDIDYRIWLVSLNNLQMLNVTSGRIDDHPTWLSDNKIVYSKGTMGSPNIPELYLVDISNGSNEVQITDDQSTRKYTPQAYREMNLIVYSGEKVNTTERDLYLISFTGSSPQPLTEDIYWQDIHPSWSSDGQKIYFTSNRSGHNEVWSIDINTRNIVQLTRGLKRGTQNFYGRTSPEGNRIAIIELKSPNDSILKIIYY